MGKYDVGEEIGGGLKDIGQAMFRREALDRQSRALELTETHRAIREAEAARVHRLTEENKQKTLAIQTAQEQRAAEEYAKKQEHRAKKMDVLSENQIRQIMEQDPEVYNTRVLPMFEDMGLKLVVDPSTGQLTLPTTRGEFEDKVKEWGSNPTNLKFAMDTRVSLEKSNAIRVAQEAAKLDTDILKLEAKGALNPKEAVQLKELMEQMDALTRQHATAMSAISTAEGHKAELMGNLTMQTNQIKRMEGYSSGEKDQMISIIQAGGSQKDAFNEVNRQRLESSRTTKMENTEEWRQRRQESTLQGLQYLRESAIKDGDTVKAKEYADRIKNLIGVKAEEKTAGEIPKPVAGIPQLVRDRKGYHPEGELGVNVSPETVTNLEILKAQFKAGNKAAFSAATTNRLNAINDLIGKPVVNGKPQKSQIEQLKELRAQAFKSGDSPVKILNDLERFFKGQISDKDMSPLESKLNAVAESFGRYYSGGGSTTSDFKIKFARDLLKGGVQQPAFEAILDTHASSMQGSQTMLLSNRDDIANQYRTGVKAALDFERIRAGKKISSDTAGIEDQPKKIKFGETW